MPSSIAISLVVLLATTCNAQFSGENLISDLIFHEQSAINSSFECRQYYADALSTSIGVRIAGDYTPGTCYNMAETFSLTAYGNDTSESEGYTSSCWPLSEDCNNTYQALNLNNYRSDANFSHVLVSPLYRDDYPEINQFVVKVFAGEACEENAPEPWFSWGGCNETQTQTFSCRELPYNVKSFRLERTDNSAECMVAAERGAGVRVSKASLAAVVGGVVVAGFMAMV